MIKPLSPQQYLDANMPILAKVITYQQMFPGYKIICLNQVKDLCMKYQLVLSNIDKFTGFIPEKNVNEIAQFKKKFQQYRVLPIGEEEYEETYKVFSTKHMADQYCFEQNEKPLIKRFFTAANFNSFNFRKRTKVEEAMGEFYICAPVNQLHITNADKLKDGFEVIENDDPIVLFVPYSDARGRRDRNEVMVITTAWGEEATDKSVFNENKN